MRFEGRVFRCGRHWAIEVPMLGVVTQGRSKREAFLMIADAIESLAWRRPLRVAVIPGKGDYFEIGAQDEAALAALLLRRLRTQQGLTVADVAKRLGAKSLNSYARYEQGRTVPSVERFSQLFSAICAGTGFVLRRSVVPGAA